MKLYQCKQCGSVLEPIYEEKKLCSDRFNEIYPNSSEGATEKHIPEVHVNGKTLKVKVASVAHPMQEDHYVTSIFVCFNNYTLRKDLTPNDLPEAEFYLGDYLGQVDVYEYCNLHGLWKTEVNV